MNEKETRWFRTLMAQYKDQWDRNQYNRTNYDEDIEYYLGKRERDAYPLIYNTVFNRILPVIYSLLSRFMEQLYQSGNIVSVRPRKKRDIHRAKAVEGTLNYQLEALNDIDMQGGSWLTMFKWFLYNLTFGKGIVKTYWKKEERISPRRLALPYPSFDRFGNFQGMDILDYVSQEMQSIYDGPYVEVVHNKLFLPHPQYRSIQKMPFVFLVYRRSIDYLKRMEDKGIFKNIRELGWSASGGASENPQDSDEGFIRGLGLEGGLMTEELEDKQKAPEVDVIEAYGRMIIDSAPYKVGSGYQIKGREQEIIAHIGNYHTLLSLQVNKYGVRPLFDIGCYMHPEMYWDLGIVRLCKGIQEQINSFGNLRMQNAFMLINQMLKVNADADIDPEALVWKPFGIIPVEDMEDVQPMVIPDVHSNLFSEQENFYDRTIQDLTGMYSYNLGQTPQREERVGVVYSIQAMGEARAKLMLMSMDYLGIRPLLKYIMILNTFHLPSGFEYRIMEKEGEDFGMIFGEDIHPDFDFAARYTAMEPALGKQFRAQQLVQMAQLWQDHPWINQYQMIKTVMELLDIKEADLLLKSPQQVMKESEQAQRMQMMADTAKQRISNQGKLQQSQMDFQEEAALAQQQFGYDLALEGIKAEAASEKSR